MAKQYIPAADTPRLSRDRNSVLPHILSGCLTRHSGTFSFLRDLRLRTMSLTRASRLHVLKLGVILAMKLEKRLQRIRMLLLVQTT